MKKIVEMKPSMAFIIHRTFYARDENLCKEQNPLLNDQIIESIENRTAVITTNTSVEDSRIGGSWVNENK